MLRKLFFFFLFLSAPLFAQTIVTGTVVDPNGNPYARGTASAYSLPASGQPVVSTTPVSTSTAGFFSLTIPSSGNYVFTICAPPVPLGPTQNPTPAQICFSSQPIAVSGGAQDISAALNSVALVIGPAANSGTGSVTPPPAAFISISVSPAAPGLNFGTVQTNTDSPPQAVTISNVGTGPAVIGSVTISGSSDFRSTNLGACNGTRAAGESCVILIFLHPTAGGAEPATTLSVSSNQTVDPINPTNISVALSGSGTGSPTFPLTINGGLSTGAGTVTSNDALINCHIAPPAAPSGACTDNYVSGATPILTGTASNGSMFVNFSGGGCSTSPCTVGAIGSATAVSAVFNITPVTFTLSVAGVGQGTGVVSSDLNDVLTGTPISCTSTAGVLTGKCSATFNQGQAPTLTETPSNSGTGTCSGGNCTFTTWAGATGCTTSSTCQVTINSNQTVSASFAAPTSGAPLALIQTISPGTNGTNQITQNIANAQSAGDTNIVYVLIDNNTTTISSVTDTKGNTYTLAAGCTNGNPRVGTAKTAALYYAKNIVAAAAGANTITVALSATPGHPFIFGAEYSGLDTSAPLDVCSSGAGSGTAVSSGNFTTNFANDLLTGADLVANHITAVSTSFTQQILNSGNDMEDRQGVAIGTYAFAPTQSNATEWVTIGAGWKNGGGGAATSFTFNVQCSGNGSGSVSASGQTLNCANGVPSGGISLTVAANSNQTLTANPLSGSTFVTYSGAGCGTTPTCVTSAITTNTVVTATFNLAGVSNFFVNGSTGSDSNSGLCAVSGTPAGCTGPWATFSKANSSFTLGASGTLITVAAGTYNTCPATNRGGTSTQQVVWQSASLYGAKIVCNGSDMWNNSASFITIKGFEMTPTDTSVNGPSCAGITSNASFVQARNNYIHDIVARGPAFFPNGCTNGGGGIDFLWNGNHYPAANSNHDNLADSNLIDGVGIAGNPSGSCAGYHGVYPAAARTTVTNNVITHNCGWGVHVYHDATTSVISNNVIIGNLRGGITVGAAEGTTNNNTSVFNNIVALNQGGEGGIGDYYNGAENGSEVGLTFRNNIVYNNTPNWKTRPCAINADTGAGCSYMTVSGTIVASASQYAGLFVNNTGNAKTGDWHLAVGSIAINAGSSVNGAPSGLPGFVPLTDFAGTARPQGPAYDCGAYDQ